MKTKLAGLLGPFAFLYQDTRLSAISCLVIALFTAFFSSGSSWIPVLSSLSLWLFLFSIKLEASLLEYTFSTPLFVFNLGIFLRAGLGPYLLSITGSGSDIFLSHWIVNAPQSQLLWLSFQSCLVGFIYIKRRTIDKAAEKLRIDHQKLSMTSSNKRYIIIFMALALFMLAYTVTSILSGAFDRQTSVYLAWTQSLWRLDTPIAFFSRFRDVWLYMTPAALLIISPRLRVATLILLSVFFFVAIFSGSRGLIFYPVLLILLGFCFALQNLRPIRSFIAATLLLIFVVSPIIFVARDTTAFQEATGIQSRIESFVVSASRHKEILQRARWLGRDLYACHDPFLFYDFNKNLTNVGSEGLDDLPYIFIPKHIYPRRPQIFKGHRYAKALQGLNPLYRDGEWYPCLSLPGDLYRRWLWPGVIAGSLLSSLLLGGLFLLWYRTISTQNSTYSLLLSFFPITYIQSFALGTLTETLWALFWELPKYLIALYLIGKLIDCFSPSARHA